MTIDKTKQLKHVYKNECIFIFRNIHNDKYTEAQINAEVHKLSTTHTHVYIY